MTTETPTVTKLGSKQAASTPRLFGRNIWFQGTDNKLWVMSIDAPDQPVNPHGITCLSSPTPAADGKVYFQTTNGAFMIMEQTAPWLHGTAAFDFIKCSGPVLLARNGDGFLPNGQSLVCQMSGKITFARFEVDISDLAVGKIGASTYAYASNKATKKLHRRNLTTPTEAETVSSLSVVDGPVFTQEGRLFVVADGNTCRELNPSTLAPLSTTPLFYFCRTTPVEAPYGNDGKLYWVTTGNELMMASKADLTFTTAKLSSDVYSVADENGHPLVGLDVHGGGVVVFLDQQQHINVVGLTIKPPVVWQPGDTKYPPPVGKPPTPAPTPA